ncbi:alkyldihydroxyacetonephosphate synthase [Stackebrandtia endophytica]|uniref:Alkyldihydroxyacetonephosphate synthase n=1 Tax=Stackebrandtia endophytica TaxID=1496996 RepID=A0A543AVA0_9ACTN|nr:FAD-binding oxidoreductase [Stackebrandtia endophytica]TQL76472.1 alkyldihydroxyacetonephosphate synthase [Stackebrandtia endophytica]
MTESELPVVAFHPYRWGDPDRPAELPPTAREALAAFGITEPAEPPLTPDQVRLTSSRLSASARDELIALVGAESVATDDATRLAHTRGWSTTDLLKLRAGDTADAPDAVIHPDSHDQVQAVLELCTRLSIAVVPYSGGTSVVGGLNPVREGFDTVIALDTSRLDELEAFDEVSHTATFGAGTRGPRVEELLREKGFTLGHFPQSYEGASIGGYAAARSAGQSSAGYGRFDEMVVGLTVATPRGALHLGTAPKSAAGPDLRQLILGSEGVFGVITSVTVRVRPAPTARVFEGWRFENFDAGTRALRHLTQRGPMPTVMRLSDEVETQVNLSDPSRMLGGGPSGCMAILGFEGSETDVAARRATVSKILTGLGGENLGTEPGDAWRKGRFRAPYLRDPLLDAGVLIETLETAAFWSTLPRLRQAVTTALTESLTSQGTQALILCHISHVYETGASLYFTVACAQTADPIAQWAAAKHAANEAIRATGAASSHHHGVGTDHRDIYAREIGPLGVEVIRGVKATLDPAGILNPGVLI